MARTEDLADFAKERKVYTGAKLLIVLKRDSREQGLGASQLATECSKRIKTTKAEITVIVLAICTEV